MFIPVRTDRRLKRIPWVNCCLIAANVLVFFFTRNWLGDPVVSNLYIHPRDAQLYQFISYQFLHADMWHLLGNMVFLYVFGNGVEDRLGRIGYLFFYLTAGIIAGISHSLLEVDPVLGASGSVAGVTGAYLALFPLSNVTILFWFVVVYAFEVSSMVLILFRVVMDLVFQALGIGSVAYLAHLAGYGYGFVLGMALLLIRVLAREPYDMLALIEHRSRRAQFQRMARGGFQPWDHAETADGPGPPVEPAARERVVELRRQIADALGRRDLPTAVGAYAELVGVQPGQVMSQQHQLDLANQLMSDGRYDTAATAYELFLRTYRDYPQTHQVQLILGLIYGRYLDQPRRARELLTEALSGLEGDDRDLAKQVLGELS